MIEVVGLTKRYGSTLAVDHLSFQVNPGVVTGFLGPNGAGKSTTMRMMLGLDTPNAGHVLIDGHRYHDLDHPLRAVGALLDANWIHPNRTARAHLSWLARSNDMPRSRVEQVLDVVGLTSVAGKAAGKFSLGMKQRLGLAAAMIGDPQILLFDEPVNGLDPEGIHWIRTFMQDLAAQGRTVFVSSHLLSEMALTASHLIVIGKGRLVADASTEDFIEHATSSAVRVRSPHLDRLRAALRDQGATVTDGEGYLSVSAMAIEQVGDVAAANGLAVHELTEERGSLEQAFIQLTGETVEYHAQTITGDGAAVPGGRSPAVTGAGGDLR